jgi:hypothetical protein
MKHEFMLDQYGHVYAWDQLPDGTKKTRVIVDGRNSTATFNERALIAAAPDLLDTLQALLEQYGRVYDNNDSQQVQAYYDAKTAIKKAKGEFK